MAVNHFKSKNCGSGDPADEDQGDGQACFNARRVLQAQALATLLDGLDPPNPLIIGDLNAYTEEDPIHTLEAAGYAGLSELLHRRGRPVQLRVRRPLRRARPRAWRHRRCSTTSPARRIWHINADEPLILDYNTEFNPPGLYQPDAYRTSDHDPLLVGLELSTAPSAPAVSALAGWGAATVSWTAPADGGSPITGYTVRARVGANVVATASVGPGVRSHTFGSLANGVSHTFEVIAVSGVGPGPAGGASATPFVPQQYKRLDARVACPSFTAHNPNGFPVSVTWLTVPGTSGRAVVPAGATVALTGTRPWRALFLFAGQNKLQDVVLSLC